MRDPYEMTTVQAGAWLGVTDRWIRKLLERKRLRGRKISIAFRRFEWFVDRSSVERYDVDRRDFERILHDRRVTWAQTQNERRQDLKDLEGSCDSEDDTYTREGGPDWQALNGDGSKDLPEDCELGEDQSLKWTRM